MSDRTHGRQTVLGTVVAIALAPLLGPATGARDGSGPPNRELPGGEGGWLLPRVAAGPLFATPSDAAIGVVDRIVVILVKDQGEVVDQIVLEIDDSILPEVSEGDVLLLWFDDEGDLVAVERLSREIRRCRRRNRDRFRDLSKRLDDPGGGANT